MKLEYTLNEVDYLTFQLFTASKSENIRRKKKTSWAVLTVGSAAIALYFLVGNNIPLAIYFSLTAVVCGIYYPNYFKWKYKKHYTKFITKNYSSIFGKSESIELLDSAIVSKNTTGEGQIELSEIIGIDEIKEYFFIKLTSGHSLIVPKTGIDKQSGFQSFFINKGISLTKELDWKWG